MRPALSRLVGLALVSALAATPALADSSPEGELHFTTAVMHLREGRIDMAMEGFKKAVKADPRNPYFQKGLGQCHAAKRDWGSAISAFRKALELNPYYVDVKNDLGYALIMSGNREAGRKEFLTAFGDPMNPAPEISAFNLGRAYLEEKNYREAIDWFRTSIARNKAYPAPYVLLAETLVAADRLPEAVADLEVAAKEAPDPEVLLALGRAYLKVGRFGEARARLEEVVKADPSGPAGKAASEQLQTLPR